MKNTNIKKSKLVILALVISLFFNFCFVFSYFYQYQRYITLYSGNEQESIEEIVEILEFNNISYKVKTENYTEPKLDETTKIIKIDIHRIDFEKTSGLIANKLNKQ